VLHGVTVAVEDGEFCVLVGPRGLRQVDAPFADPQARGDFRRGDLHRFRKWVNDVEPKERDIAMVFQNYALYPHMNVYDNMAFSLKLAGESREDTACASRRRPDPRLQSTSSATRASFRAASASAWRWGAQSSASHSIPVRRAAVQISTPSCAWPCAPNQGRCISARRRPSVYVTHDQIEAMHHGRQDRGNERRPRRADRLAARSLRQPHPTCSSLGSSARRR